MHGNHAAFVALGLVALLAIARLAILWPALTKDQEAPEAKKAPAAPAVGKPLAKRKARKKR